MNRKWPLLVVMLVLVPLPAFAGSFGAYGTYWDPDNAESSAGAGARLGFDFVKFLELEFHGSRFSTFQTDPSLPDVEITATPVDGGLRVNFLPASAVNPYIGAGASYYFLEADNAEIDNQAGWYGEAGLDFGGKHTRAFTEAIWRKIDTPVSLEAFDTDAQFDGISFNAGVLWRWGK